MTVPELIQGRPVVDERCTLERCVIGDGGWYALAAVCHNCGLDHAVVISHGHTKGEGGWRCPRCGTSRVAYRHDRWLGGETP